MRFHREGSTIILIALAVTTLLSWLVYYFLPLGIASYLLWTMLFIVLVLFLQFFRYPKRIPDFNESHVISPCDGKVVVIQQVFEKEYLKRDVIQVSVFMSPLNVHINWYPISGEVSYFKYHPGNYLVAWHPKSSELNERSTVVLKNGQGTEILVRQIAGVLARKIVCYSRQGQQVKQGEELGFIKFGSRVDLFLPLGTDIKVQLGEKVKGNRSVIAVLP